MKIKDDAPEIGAVFHLEVEKIFPNPQQPRRSFDEEALRELASSIREFGILQPLIVSKIEKEVENGTQIEYQLIAGERRLLAAKMIGLERVPAIIRKVSADREKLELAVIENVQRDDLNPIESARAYAKLQDEFKLTQREIASRVGKSREYIANAVRLLNLPSGIQDAVAEGKINESQARLLLGISELADQEMLFQSIIRDNLSVREVKTRIRGLVTKEKDEKSRPEITPEIQLLKERLETFLGTKVDVRQNGETGKITINFYSAEELQGIIEKVTKEGNSSL
ncbi:MAG: hypothetical protein A3H06_01815 [Candidatus Colwellbacteria bacterium RIFCSPLOWO2_12_FULL_44_13]|uniref:ParB-like N-terminal domain-containing protein n=3 Tax=Candidatus Colwelliibacteriota TaxID=1817904 RepID=A0A1G1Z7Z4_9BACT|nr:MAG: hypothetical protein A3F24_00305 [Candidatus Colwellbacteria bacterium RIFCSPHIGHO2_12_FULL_44_17]OGY60634.1 MAG: hypothetical protein A3I31_00860 [Candidatus Colwellbacteria bacterium RIFCSPLOWO2_02_FULL_44_20b]OGY61907.1 MAG: hypothetical protein A3H06_01815 [Candidatus Colwellbacteria bacterium RIFCSPLOWO2_12_FULL_44_13]